MCLVSLIFLYRIYDGMTPVLLVFDAKWLREAYITHWPILANRKPFSFGGTLEHSILFLKDDHWRHVRSILSPVFTQGKLKQVTVMCLSCAYQASKGCGVKAWATHTVDDPSGGEMREDIPEQSPRSWELTNRHQRVCCQIYSCEILIKIFLLQGLYTALSYLYLTCVQIWQ